MIKRILFLVFIITSLSASAQLTVTNSSYIYVDGDGFTEGTNVAPLYVTNEVNLTGVNSNIFFFRERAKNVYLLVFLSNFEWFITRWI